MSEEKAIPEEEKYTLCDWCSGSGMHYSGSDAGCPKCSGRGEIPNPTLKEED